MTGAREPGGLGIRQRHAAELGVGGRGSSGQVVGALASGAKKAPNSDPDDAVESLDTIVLLIRFTASESCNDTPPPSHPATLLVMMLLVTLTEYQRSGLLGKVPTSAPLTPWKRMPPPRRLPQRYP